MVLATRSPTTLPIDPPINRKSMTASATGRPPIFPTPLTTASARPVFLRARASRSSYPSKPRGSPASMPRSCSSKLPVSVRSRIRPGAGSG